MICIAGVVLVFLLILSLPVAMQARKRGYPLLPWLIAGVLGNVIFLLILLGVLPDFARRKHRENYRRRIEEKLASKQGEATALLPSTPGDGVDHSLGDLPTELPQRSLGDEATRL